MYIYIYVSDAILFDADNEFTAEGLIFKTISKYIYMCTCIIYMDINVYIYNTYIYMYIYIRVCDVILFDSDNEFTAEGLIFKTMGIDIYMCTYTICMYVYVYIYDLYIYMNIYIHVSDAILFDADSEFTAEGLILKAMDIYTHVYIYIYIHTYVCI